MGYFITEPIGLIIAFLNVTTILLSIYFLLLLIADSRSRVFRMLDTIFTPVLNPLRKIFREGRLDASPAVLAVVLQVLSFAIKWNFQ